MGQGRETLAHSPWLAHLPTTTNPSVVRVFSGPNLSFPYEPMDGSPESLKSNSPVMPS